MNITNSCRRVFVTLLIRLPLLALGPLPPPPLSISGSRSLSVLSRSCKLPHFVPVPFPLAAGAFPPLHLSLPLRPQVPHSSHAAVAFAVTLPLPVSVSFSVPVLSLGHQRGKPGLRSDQRGSRFLLLFWLQHTFVKVQLQNTRPGC